MASLVSIKNLSHVYSKGTPFEKTAVAELNLEIAAGEFVGIIGHTGSGKSTFVQHLNGLLKPTSGAVELDGEDILSGKRALRDARFRVGLVFQYPEYQLFEETVYKDIAFGPKNMKLSAEDIDSRVRRAAGFVGVPETLFERSPLEISGGQKRRVAIAGVIAMEPDVLVLDEPTAGLDPAGRESILQNICDYHAATGGTVLLISHNMEEVARLVSRIVVFDNGGIAYDDTPQAVFRHAAELESMGLTVPAPAKIAARLRELGIDLPEGIYTLEQLESCLIALKGGSAPC